MANNAKMVDDQIYIALGIDPVTKKPLRLDIGCGSLKPGIIQALRILDEQDAVNRYKWYNLPNNISSQELERLLYLKGQLCFFYNQTDGKFYFMPYALDGTIDFYGRFNTVHPVPIASGGDDKGYEDQRNYLASLKLKVLYDTPLEEVDFAQCCVLLKDYTNGIAQTVVPRSNLQEPILDVMADCLPFMRTALLNGTGIQGMRVNNQDEYSNVEAASRSINNAALTGKKWVAVQGSVDFQDLTGGEIAKAEEFLLAMQSIDNFRLSLYGLDNGGLFQKKSHVLEAEQEMNAGNAGIPLQDGLSWRQRFCDIVNSVTDLGIYCEIAEPVIGADMDGDGLAMDEQDQSGAMPGEQPEGEVNE